jgi:2-polyprenyl-3-methyl-5-hydroxy-6-metoxy-1,4-benzoquinol methylase
MSRPAGPLLATRAKQQEHYDGILVHADLGVHELCEATLGQYVPAPAKILDLGAGAGALSLRLHRGGYDMTAIDVDASEWQAPGIRFLEGDATAPLSTLLGDARFDAVCCVEVIEHVENQADLLRQAHDACRPGGYLLVTTPNITSFLSRAIFLRTGQFHQFADADLSYGHISPITPWELSVLATRTGWNVRQISPAGSLALLDFSGGFWGSLRMNLLRLLSRLIARRNVDGWCLLVVLQKPPE